MRKQGERLLGPWRKWWELELGWRHALREGYEEVLVLTPELAWESRVNGRNMRHLVKDGERRWWSKRTRSQWEFRLIAYGEGAWSGGEVIGEVGGGFRCVVRMVDENMVKRE
ncbi:hypothetical protein Tco_0955258 [Tanacetum coccineum]|uniref:Uncharacterized protein n=1 Tax=Tanacetum coccineum TaxID=301880 RepID=A0ABQ5E6Q2_9ASTR